MLYDCDSPSHFVGLDSLGGTAAAAGAAAAAAADLCFGLSLPATTK